MKIIYSKDDSWVAVRREIAHSKTLDALTWELQQKVFRTELWLSDLDDTHAPSPAKHAALHALGTSHLRPHYWWWGLRSALRILGGDATAETESWREYVHSFLRSPAALDEIKSRFTVERAAATLYPGVASLHTRILSHVPRCYVTRNIREIVDPYAQALAFQGVVVEAFDKGRAVQEIVCRFPHLTRYAVEGDSADDGQIVAALRDAGKEVLGLYVMKEPNVRRLDIHFDYAVSRSRAALVDLLSSSPVIEN